MAHLPKALEELISELGKLPGVGPRTAERYAMSILKSPSSKAASIARSLERLHEGVSYCEVTFALTEPGTPVSRLYSDPGRDKSTIMVVEDALDVLPIEKTGVYRGTYHVLGGLISPIDEIGPESIRIKELVQRVENDEVNELILATSAGVEGETTALYIQRELLEHDVKITRLARGIPVGVDLEYTDQNTLMRAVEGRQNF